MNTFTAKELADFYQKVADGGEIEYKLLPKDCFGYPENGPHMGCSKDAWRIKPTNKVIDMSSLIDGIDCQFKDLDADSWVIGKLKDVAPVPDKSLRFWKQQGDSGCWYDKCRPRMHHIHAIAVEDFEEAGNIREKLTTAGFVFSFYTFDCIDRCIILLWDFGLADGYVMPWVKD